MNLIIYFKKIFKMNKEDKTPENELSLHSYIKTLEQQINMLQRRVSLLEQQNTKPYLPKFYDFDNPEFPPKFC